MKNLSIKTQLTIWYSVTILLVALILFISFYFITSRSISLETDRSLLDHASQIANNIGLNTDNVFDSQTQEIIDVSRSQIPGLFVRVTDELGNDIQGQKDGIYIQLARAAVQNKKEVYTNQTIGGIDLRLVSYPIKRAESIIGIVLMGHQIDIHQQALAKLKNIAILLLVFLISPSILIGYFLAYSAIKPINTISESMRTISSENLSNRAAIPPKSLETFSLVNSFNSLLDRLAESFNRERQFIGEVAHEIKTPLSVIKSNAEVTLSKDRVGDEYKKSLTQILDHTTKLSKRLSGLIDFAWSRSEDIKKHFAKVNISEVFRTVCENTKHLAESKKISVGCDITTGLFVDGIEEKFFRVFYNIADNAVKFTPEKGTINFSLKKENSTAIARVSDTGIGIDSDDLRIIFDRFYRSENAKSVKGHGLGLAIASAIIKAHGGEIRAESVKGRGTTFVVALPISS